MPVRDDGDDEGAVERSHISSFSGGGECVRVSRTCGGAYLVAHSTAAATPVRFTSAEWRAFVRGVKAGEFDF